MYDVIDFSGFDIVCHALTAFERQQLLEKSVLKDICGIWTLILSKCIDIIL